MLRGRAIVARSSVERPRVARRMGACATSASSCSSPSWCSQRSSPRRAQAADYADEQALAEKYAPVVRIVEQPRTSAVTASPSSRPTSTSSSTSQTVALRGPWNVTDLVEIGPSANDLVDRFEYHLDFPGNALDSGLRLQPLGETADGGQRAGRLCARRGENRVARASSRSSTGSSTRSTTSTTRTKATGR